jgi:hypothetical protein
MRRLARKHYSWKPVDQRSWQRSLLRPYRLKAELSAVSTLCKYMDNSIRRVSLLLDGNTIGKSCAMAVMHNRVLSHTTASDKAVVVVCTCVSLISPLEWTLLGGLSMSASPNPLAWRSQKTSRKPHTPFAGFSSFPPGVRAASRPPPPPSQNSFCTASLSLIKSSSINTVNYRIVPSIGTLNSALPLKSATVLDLKALHHRKGSVQPPGSFPSSPWPCNKNLAICK